MLDLEKFYFDLSLTQIPGDEDSFWESLKMEIESLLKNPSCDLQKLIELYPEKLSAESSVSWLKAHTTLSTRPSEVETYTILDLAREVFKTNFDQSDIIFSRLSQIRNDSPEYGYQRVVLLLAACLKKPELRGQIIDDTTIKSTFGDIRQIIGILVTIENETPLLSIKNL